MNKYSEPGAIFKTQQDLTLINNIKKGRKTNDSLKEIIARHSGVYLDIVNQYCHDNQSQMKKDLVRDKDFHIYQTAIKYDENKKTKFSTYLGNEARWMCLNTYNRQKKFLHVEYDEVVLQKNPEAQVGEVKDATDSEILNRVFSIIKKNPDSRVFKIFNMRYVVGKKNKVMPWKYIGAKLNMSIQGCINIHNSTLEKIKLQVQKEIS